MRHTTILAITMTVVMVAMAVSFAIDSTSKDDKIVAPPFTLSGKMSDHESAYCYYNGEKTKIVDVKSELSAVYTTGNGIHCELTLVVVSDMGEFSVLYQYEADDGELIPIKSVQEGVLCIFTEPLTGDRLTITPSDSGISKIRFQGETAVQRSSSRYSIISFDVSTKMSGNAKYYIDNKPRDAANQETVFRISGMENGKELSGTARIIPVHSYGAHYDDGEYYATFHIYRCVLDVEGTSLPMGLRDFLFRSTGQNGGTSLSAFTDDGHLISYRLDVNRNDEDHTLYLNGMSEDICIVDGTTTSRQMLTFYYKVA